MASLKASAGWPTIPRQLGNNYEEPNLDIPISTGKGVGISTRVFIQEEGILLRHTDSMLLLPEQERGKAVEKLRRPPHVTHESQNRPRPRTEGTALLES